MLLGMNVAFRAGLWKRQESNDLLYSWTERSIGRTCGY